MLFNGLLAPFTNNIIDRPNNHKTRLKVVCAIFCFLKITSFHTPHNNFKRGCQHPLNKFEILWQVAKIFFSLLLLYFVAQYFQIVVVYFFFLKICFSFREMTLFVCPRKYADKYYRSPGFPLCFPSLIYIISYSRNN